MGVTTNGKTKDVFPGLPNRRSTFLPETKHLQGFKGGLHLKMSSLLKFSNPYLHKNYIFFGELRYYNDDYTGSQVTEAIISFVFIFAQLHLHSSPHSQCALQLFLGNSLTRCLGGRKNNQD